MFIGYFPQNTPIISGKNAESNLEVKDFYVFARRKCCVSSYIQVYTGYFPQKTVIIRGESVESDSQVETFYACSPLRSVLSRVVYQY